VPHPRHSRRQARRAGCRRAISSRDSTPNLRGPRRHGWGKLATPPAPLMKWWWPTCTKRFGLIQVFIKRERKLGVTGPSRGWRVRNAGFCAESGQPMAGRYLRAWFLDSRPRWSGAAERIGAYRLVQSSVPDGAGGETSRRGEDLEAADRRAVPGRWSSAAMIFSPASSLAGIWLRASCASLALPPGGGVSMRA